MFELAVWRSRCRLPVLQKKLCTSKAVRSIDDFKGETLRTLKRSEVNFEKFEDIGVCNFVLGLRVALPAGKVQSGAATMGKFRLLDLVKPCMCVLPEVSAPDRRTVGVFLFRCFGRRYVAESVAEGMWTWCF